MTIQEIMAEFERLAVEDGATVPSIRVLYGKETFYNPDAKFQHGDHPVGKNGECHDCGAAVGAFHMIGCDFEQCHDCDGQLWMGCECDESEGDESEGE